MPKSKESSETEGSGEHCAPENPWVMYAGVDQRDESGAADSNAIAYPDKNV